MYRIVLVSDLHGSTICFRKLLSIAKNYERIDYLIINGDLSGKFIAPIIEQNGKYLVSYNGSSIEVSRQELNPIMEKIENSGEYFKFVSPEEYEAIRNDPAKIESEFVKLACERLEKWMEMATSALKGTNAKLLINGGNDDPYSLDEIVKKHQNDNIVYSEDKIVILKDRDTGGQNEMIACGNANITPWNCYRDVPEESLYEILENKIKGLNDIKNSIFTIHVPPYGTVIDRAPKLDKSKEKAVTFAGHTVYESVGSKAVRTLIEKYQPMLSLHGHIHEGKGACKIGRTLCVNAGSEYQNGVLNYALIVIENSKVKNYIMMSG